MTTLNDIDVPVLAQPAATGIEYYRDPFTGDVVYETTDQLVVTAYRDTSREEHQFGPSEGVSIKIDSRTLVVVTGAVAAVHANLTIVQARDLADAIVRAADNLE